MKHISNHSKIYRFLFITLIYVVAWLFLGFFRLASDEVIVMLRATMIRFALATIFIFGLYIKGYFVFHSENKSLKTTWWLIIPALLISINNFPWHILYQGDLTLTVNVGTIILFLIECFSVGLFEEILFRYLIFIVIMQHLDMTKKNIFIAMVITSIVFGLFHLINLFSGAGLGTTIQQVGYTTVLGLMWSMTFFITRNIWVPIILHTTYNFFGIIAFRYGTIESRYDPFTIILTIVLALLATIFYIIQFKSLSTNRVNAIIEQD